MNGRHEEALHWYGQAAAQDDKEGLFKLGTMYEEGNGVPQDGDAAAFWYRKAAKQGHAEAQWQLGQMLEYDGY
jgi:TPR repeat protein